MMCTYMRSVFNGTQSVWTCCHEWALVTAFRASAGDVQRLRLALACELVEERLQQLRLALGVEARDLQRGTIWCNSVVDAFRHTIVALYEKCI